MVLLKTRKDTCIHLKTAILALMKTNIFLAIFHCSIFTGLAILPKWHPKYFQPKKAHAIISLFPVIKNQISPAEPFEILINEIMADPTPSIGLPEAEFIELYNHSDKVFDLKDYQLHIGSRKSRLPHVIIEPRAYYILCKSEYADQFIAWGNTIPLVDLPAIPNAGSQVRIEDGQGLTIHGVNYTQNWYISSETANGGWTLELIDPDKACYFGMNWTSSRSPTGGTPGKVNSWTGSQTQTDSFRIITAIPAKNQLRIVFNRNLLQIGKPDLSWFSIRPSPPHFSKAYFEEGLNSNLILGLNQPLVSGIKYIVEFDNVIDCLGNPLIKSTSEFKLPESASPGDVLINEILFNPISGGKDFLELINVSQKYLAINDLWLANTCSALNVEKLNPNYLLKPGDIIAISDDIRQIQQDYNVPDPYSLIENPIPAFNDHSGCAVLYTIIGHQRIIIDSFHYMKEFHTPLLKDQEGVSLERVSIRQPTNDPNNWQSAAQTAGYGTPGARNSQMKEVRISSGKFKISPIKFSPDGDGFDDFMQIHFMFERPGFGLLIKIFDIRGRLIRFLVNGKWVSASGVITWDGSTDDGIIAPAGVYTIWIKAYSESGHIEQSIKNCILARNF